MLSLLKPYQLILTALFAAVLAAFANNYLLYGTLFILSIFIFSSFSRRVFIGVFLIALLIISSKVGVNVRMFIQFSSIGIMILFFIKDYGFNIRGYKEIPKPIVNYLLYFFGVLLFSSFISEYPSAGLVLVFRSAVFFILVYVIYSLIQEKADEIMFFRILIIAGVILTLSVPAEHIISGNNLFDLVALTSDRKGGLVSSVNSSAGLLANLIPLILCFLFYSKLTKNKKTLLWILLFVISIGLFMTGSRASYVSLFISIIIVFYTLRKSLLKWLLGFVGFFFIIFLTYEPLNETIQMMLRIEAGLSGRETFWALSMNIVKENILFGIGPGSYKYEVYNYFPVLLDSWRGSTVIHIMEITDGTNSSHNFYLLFFSDMGILGLLAAILIVVVFYKICIPVLIYFKTKSEYNYLVTLAVIAIGTGLFIRSFFMEVGLLNYGYITADLPFWMFFSVVINYYRKIFILDKRSETD